MKSGHPQIKIGIGIVCFIETIREVEELKRCLKSVESFFPVILIDGKWKDYPSDITTSIPEAQEVIENYSNVIYIKSPNKTEAENRNQYLNYDLDYLIILDTDEFIQMPLGVDFFKRGLIDVFKGKQELCSYVHAFSKKNGGYVRMQRIIKNPKLLHYSKKHNEILDGKTNVLRYPLDAPRGLIIQHDKFFRDDDRIKKMKKRNKESNLY